VIRFWVAGLPRSMQIQGVAGFKKAGKVHMVPKRANTPWAVLVGHEGRLHAPPTPFDGPVSIFFEFWMPRPASASKGVLFPLKRPDIDNLCHKLTDAWNGVFWVDDSQVIDSIARRRFSSNGQTGLRVTVVEGPLTMLVVGETAVLVQDDD